MKYECGVCGYVYDEAKESVAFAELSEGWKCPICSAAKIYFKPMEEMAQEEYTSPVLGGAGVVEELLPSLGFDPSDRFEDTADRHR